MMVAMADLGIPTWSVAAALALGVGAAVVDLRIGKVPGWLTYPAVLAALVAHLIIGGWSGEPGQIGLSGSLIGLLAGFGPMLVFWLLGGIGGGDAKLMGALGALGGWRFVLAVLIYSMAAAAVMAVVVMIRRGIVVRTLKRMWNMLSLTLSGVKPAGPSEDSPQVPFAVAVCVGVLASIAERVFLPAAGLFWIGG
jgi:prepilin peptidase CpaA